MIDDARFLSRIAVRPNGCVEYCGARDAKGYGWLTRHGRQMHAHRWAWTLSRGPIPDGLFVCHSCDNRICVNVDHLFLGTHKQNMADMRLKGRNPGNGGKIGANNHMSKLDAASVRIIRSRLADGHMQKDIAFDFGVSPSSIRQVKTRQTWDHVK